MLIADYFLTVHSIGQHAQEFNPVVVYIYGNLPFPWAFFLGLKALTMALTGLLLHLFRRLGRLGGKVSLAYVLLACTFAAGVVAYDLAVILGADVSWANSLSSLFFRAVGLA